MSLSTFFGPLCGASNLNLKESEPDANATDTAIYILILSNVLVQVLKALLRVRMTGSSTCFCHDLNMTDGHIWWVWSQKGVGWVVMGLPSVEQRCHYVNEQSNYARADLPLYMIPGEVKVSVSEEMFHFLDMLWQNERLVKKLR